jgi:hypothetical protein
MFLNGDVKLAMANEAKVTEIDLYLYNIDIIDKLDQLNGQ